MVDERKVRLMTRLSIYEKHEKNRNLVLSRYYKSDYVRFNVLKTWVAATVAFWAVVGLCATMSFDDILAELNNIDYFDIMYKFLAAYVVCCAVLMFFANLVYKYRYSKAKPGLVKYNSMLKDLIELQGGPIHRSRMVANSEAKTAPERANVRATATKPNSQNTQNRVNRSEVVKRRMEQEEKSREQQIIENVKQRNERIAAKNQAELQRQQQIMMEKQRIQQRRQQLEQEQMEKLRNERTQQAARENHVYRGTNDANERKER